MISSRVGRRRTREGLLMYLTYLSTRTHGHLRVCISQTIMQNINIWQSWVLDTALSILAFTSFYVLQLPHHTKLPKQSSVSIHDRSSPDPHTCENPAGSSNSLPGQQTQLLPLAYLFLLPENTAPEDTNELGTPPHLVLPHTQKWLRHRPDSSFL